MALKKEITLPSGVVADYIKVSAAVVDLPNLQISVFYSVHLSQAHSASAPVVPPGIAKAYSATKEQLLGNPIALGYTFLKQEDEFADAEDV